VAVVVGCFESLMARLPLKWVTGYVWVAGWLTLAAAALVGVSGGGLMNLANNPTLALIACLLATVIPVFFGRLSSTPTWLSLQALALGWLTLNQHHELDLHAPPPGWRFC
jgi:hypothetical protein